MFKVLYLNIKNSDVKFIYIRISEAFLGLQCSKFWIVLNVSCVFYEL